MSIIGTVEITANRKLQQKFRSQFVSVNFVQFNYLF